MTTRRSILAAVLAAPALAITSLKFGEAQAQASQIGAIRVDVSRLTAQGWGSQALAIKLGMERELAAQLGPALRRGAGPTLNVAVRGVFLNSYAGGGGGGRWGGGGNAGADSLDSEATLVERGNRVVATWPVLSTVSSASAGPWYLPDIDQRRLDGLIRHNAAWIKRYVAG
jgi:hypothetical protein